MSNLSELQFEEFDSYLKKSVVDWDRLRASEEPIYKKIKELVFGNQNPSNQESIRNSKSRDKKKPGSRRQNNQQDSWEEAGDEDLRARLEIIQDVSKFIF